MPFVREAESKNYGAVRSQMMSDARETRRGGQQVCAVGRECVMM
jgi:hypothetical protein